MAWIKKNIYVLILLLIAAAFLFVPSFKVATLQGLMQLGIFNPSLELTKEVSKAKLDPSFLIEDNSGKQVNYTQIQNKTVIINFWATWCPPCKAELPSIHKLYTQIKSRKDIQLILIDADGTVSESTKLLQKKGLDIPNYKLLSPISPEIFKGSLPTTVVINRQGSVVLQHSGIMDFSNEAFIKQILSLK